jgi:hypothetical protein
LKKGQRREGNSTTFKTIVGAKENAYLEQSKAIFQHRQLDQNCFGLVFTLVWRV